MSDKQNDYRVALLLINSYQRCNINMSNLYKFILSENILTFLLLDNYRVALANCPIYPHLKFEIYRVILAGLKQR